MPFILPIITPLPEEPLHLLKEGQHSVTVGAAVEHWYEAHPPPPPPNNVVNNDKQVYNVVNNSTSDTVTSWEFSAWSRVNVCEESGNWHTPIGGLGILPDNWIKYGGQRDFGSEQWASPSEQITVAMRIQSSPPDQGYCSSW